MKEPDDLLRNAPRTQPRESLDHRMGALFNEARNTEEPGWLGFRIPAWAAVLACLVCLAIGRSWTPQMAPVPQVSQPSAPEPQLGLPSTPRPAASEPEVYVQVTQQASSTFNRTVPTSKPFKISTWTVTQ